LSAIVILPSITPSTYLLWYTYHQYFHLLAILIVGYILFKVLINFSESYSNLYQISHKLPPVLRRFVK
jgi:hypothetical protein